MYQRHLNSVGMIGGRATEDDGVVFFDLRGYDQEGYNKFIPYYLFPNRTYSLDPEEETKFIVHLDGDRPHGALDAGAPECPRHNDCRLRLGSSGSASCPGKWRCVGLHHQTTSVAYSA
ncbi:MAG TPA: hypothetical protein VN924_04990 [Bryobacteraceae bacterium]|nr:hypothetical protein [Bryobacteraceae bacterium]